MQRKRARFGPCPTHPSERFWEKVRVRGTKQCWEWTGARNPDGYGFMYAGPFYEIEVLWVRAHRLSFEMHNGPVPAGLYVLHKCDNPGCVNPAHLYAGTQAQNVLDRAGRRRGKELRQKGESNDNAKLREADVRKILALLEAGESQTAVAKKFGITQPYVSKLARGEFWQHLWER